MKRVVEVRSGLPTPLRAAFSMACLLLILATPAFAKSFIVDTTTDGPQDSTNITDCVEVDAMTSIATGHCSLRAAIEVGNGITGPHTIDFTLPPASTITVLNGGGMADIRAQFVITGGGVTIDGNGLGCLTLTDSGTDTPADNSHVPPILAVSNGKGATGSTITGFNIGNCGPGNLAAIEANGHGYTIANNHIGVGIDGKTQVGPVLPLKQSGGNGIYLSASTDYDDATVGKAALLSLYNSLPAQPVDETQIAKFAENITNALVTLNPNTITGNVISNNAGDGIVLSAEALGGTIITLNFIGTDPTGTIAVPNGGNGISLGGSTFANIIGPGNVISGNTLNGINASAGPVFLPNFVMGNIIGLPTADGTHIGNQQSGIFVDSAPDTSVAHFNPTSTALIIGPANIIGDNQGSNNNPAFPDVLGTPNAGIVITGSAKGVKVTGNRIGLAQFAPLLPLSYGNKGDGITVTTSGNSISGNVIAANGRHGIVVSGSATQSNSITGNTIGGDPASAGVLTLGNASDGIHIDAASSTTIGGPGATDFNTVVGNGRNGIKIRNGGTNGDVGNGWGNLSQRNLVYHNATSSVPIPLHAGIGIDLDQIEDAPDDPSIPENLVNTANLGQAHPIICLGPADPGNCAGSVPPTSSAGTTSLQWTITTHGPANFRVEFFQIDTADDNTATKITFLGEDLFSTGLSGLPVDSAECSAGRCTSSLAANLGGGYVLMTATDITPLIDMPGGTMDWKGALTCFAGDLGILLSECNVNNTSEFSAVAQIPAAAPTVITTTPTNVTGIAATLQGSVSANGADATVSFEYGTTATYGTTIAGTPSPVTAAQSDITVGANIGGLTCGTTYHYRIDATNSQGTSLGNDLSFDTALCSPAAPSATTTAASAIFATTATLNGIVSSNGATTTVKFQFGTTIAYGDPGSPASATPASLSSGASNSPVSFALSGLDCATNYHFRVTTNNSQGAVNGGDLTFTTAACSASAPTVTTTAATGVTATSAKVNGTVSANGGTTVVNFDFGPTTAYGVLGSPATATQSALTPGATSAPVSITLTGLTCATTYHFRANANNGVLDPAIVNPVDATIHGNDSTFTTGACVQPPPSATTFAASGVAVTTATFTGLVSANGASTSVVFDYGTDTTYGSVATPAASPISTNGTTVTFAASGLACNATIHYRVRATNSGGTTNGGDQSFKTGTCPVPAAVTGVASAITMTGATLNGTVSANGGATTVTFEYGTSASYGTTLAATQSPLASGSPNNAPVSLAITGLTCNTLYHFRVDANNGTAANGSDATFTTSACPIGAPGATTGVATAITQTGATLNGTVSANGAATTVNFEYGTTVGYGTTLAATQSPLASGSPNNAPVSLAITGLTCNTLYHFRVDANNGTAANGSDATFTTSACPIGAPGATTGVATAITQTGATLNGTVSANGAATTVNFEYGTTVGYGTTLAATQSPLASGSPNNAPVSLAITGLTCNTLYHFRVDANNGTAANGSDATFTTSACPIGAPGATTGVATAITQTGATLNGTVSANGAATTVNFEYGTTVGYGTTLAATQSPLASGSPNNAPVSLAITGLTCNTLYHFRVDANNGTAANGSDATFTTSACPIGAPGATTGVATAITQTGATLNGTVSANGAATTVNFEYGTTVGYGTTLAATQSPLASGSPNNAPVSLAITGLTCNTLYHFRVDANNGTAANGSDATFTTSACPIGAPGATTGVATAITQTGATLNGTVSANGAATTVNFEYGTTVGYGTTLAATQSPLASGSPNNAPVSLAITGLTCNTLYHFRVDANNGTAANGSDATFTTSACPIGAPGATTGVATAITQTGATLNGTVSANGAATTVNFEYGTTVGYGTTLAATQSPLASGSPNNAPVSLAITGLTCNTLYHFRVDANNGTAANGSDATFTTSACPIGAPGATTGVATAITQTGATLNGTVSANGAATTVNFEYGTTVGYGTTLAATQSPLASGSPNNAPVSLAITGLTCNTLYHFRVDANNGTAANGSDATFTTSACPIGAPGATTGVATAITQTGATLNGTVSANGAATTVNFEYGTTVGYGTTLAATQSPLASGSPNNAPVSLAITGLTCNTLYHFRVDANNGTAANGSDATFTTSACPIGAPGATTGVATAITQTGATLNGTVSANGAATTVNFEYGTTVGYGTTMAATQSPLAAGSPANAPVSLAITGLTCNTLYHFRVDANNGTAANGSDATFTTSACPIGAPGATTGVATAITQTGATLNGTVSANGAATTVNFEYGTTVGYGTTLAATQSPLASGSPNNAPVSLAITGLTCNTLYHFRVDANNGTAANGSDATFTTSACPIGAPGATTGVATAITQTGATLNGTVSANGAATTVNFEYGTTVGYGTTLAATQSPLASGSPNNAPVSLAITGLTCNTLYHFRVDANNGTAANGSDATFTTSGCPSVTTYSAMTYTGTGFASVVLSGGGASCTLSNLAFVGPPTAPPAGYTFPDGLFQFSANNCVGTITVTVTFPTTFSGGEQYYKYGPTSGQLSPHWYTLGAGNSLTLVGNVATFTIADGGLGDDDLAINGTIVDQGGPAAPAAAPPEITPEAAPSLNLWALLVLAGLLSLFGATQTRKRSH